jgi:uncharacterized membrane protein
MEDKMIVAVFDSERKAYEGLKAINDMDADGSITLYASAVIAKDTDGKLTVKQTAEEGPLGTGVGLLTGSLMGVLGGPAGLAAGALVGMTGGAFYDLARAGVGGDFLDEVGRQLTPGKVAVVAEVWEEWVTPLDTRMEAVGGIVLRRTRDEFVDAQVERDIAALKADVANLNAELARADVEARAKLQAKIDTAKTKLKAAQDRAGAEAEATRREMDAKLRALRGNVAKAKGDAKAKLEARIAEVQSDYRRRADKLHEAWKLTKEAVAPNR